ncbi:hypothetical protein OPKNFCMD_0780 [Methylobacterium crusticola]|uniref:Proteophosphoglycan ppg4 n=1 Tax=Methylobacterium crusticola TaxID=1697972 RepID=A0ABQ4QTN8_9HYPH|nr:hypothetical protein [Methylobacterium crusticola]GJD48064.1 hypothetical protein OPKNFCMD_0780 [Methylobacterium crusticola]
MRTVTLAIAASLAFGGVALAQTTAPGSTERNMNNPASVKSNAEKGMPGRDLPASTGTVAPGGPGTAAPAGADASTSGHSGGANTSSGPATGTR